MRMCPHQDTRQCSVPSAVSAQPIVGFMSKTDTLRNHRQSRDTGCTLAEGSDREGLKSAIPNSFRQQDHSMLIPEAVSADTSVGRLFREAPPREGHLTRRPHAAVAPELVART